MQSIVDPSPLLGTEELILQWQMAIALPLRVATMNTEVVYLSGLAVCSEKWLPIAFQSWSLIPPDRARNDNRYTLLFLFAHSRLLQRSSFLIGAFIGLANRLSSRVPSRIHLPDYRNVIPGPCTE